MSATWLQASAADFIARSRQAWAKGMMVIHGLDGCSIDINGGRAVAQTKMRITQRGAIDGVLVDVTCHGRFWDALEKLNGGAWLMRLRQPIYELDQITTVDPGASLHLDPNLLAAFPEGYRHLAYLQTKLGFEVSKSKPGTRGPEIENLMARGRRWLNGDAADCLDAHVN